MKWESWGLAEGPHGLREVTVYASANAEGEVKATYVGNRTHAQDLRMLVDIWDGKCGLRPIARATVQIYNYEYNREKARSWLLDMCRVWAKED